MLYKHPERFATARGRTDITSISTPIRVAAVPSGHPYVDAITDPTEVVLLPDPVPPGAPAGQWWPPQMLTEAWLDRHGDDFDILHLHFGLESFTPVHLERVIAQAQSAGRPVIYTVHDLDNPQLTDQRAYRDILDVVVPAADALVTLTSTAAAEVSARWGRECAVLPHPTLLGDAPGATDRATGATVRVGMHLRDLRPNIDGPRAVRDLVAAAERLDADGLDVRAEVRMNERVRDAGAASDVQDAVAGASRVRLERSGRLDDAVLRAWLSGLDAFVLPYTHGTHSGWAELCYDLGVAVIGTRIGHIAAQHPGDFIPYTLGDPDSLADAIAEAARRTVPGDDLYDLPRRRRERLAERTRVRAAHYDLYASAITRRRAS